MRWRKKEYVVVRAWWPNRLGRCAIGIVSSTSGMDEINILKGLHVCDCKWWWAGFRVARWVAHWVARWVAHSLEDIPSGKLYQLCLIHLHSSPSREAGRLVRPIGRVFDNTPAELLRLLSPSCTWSGKASWYTPIQQYSLQSTSFDHKGIRNEGGFSRPDGRLLRIFKVLWLVVLRLRITSIPRTNSNIIIIIKLHGYPPLRRKRFKCVAKSNQCSKENNLFGIGETIIRTAWFFTPLVL